MPPAVRPTSPGAWQAKYCPSASVSSSRSRISRERAAISQPGFVVNAPPDGYTILLVTQSNSINATLYSNLNFNFIRDIVPIASLMQAPSLLVVNPSVPINSVPELIAYAEANPGKLADIATADNGSPPQLYGELFKLLTGVNMATVNYRGGEPGLVDLLAGQVQVMFEGITSSIGYVRGRQAARARRHVGDAH